MLILLYFLQFGINASNNIFTKNLQTSVKMDLPKSLYLNLLNAFFALFFYFIKISFNLTITPLTISFSILYAVFCFISVTQSIFLLEYISLAMFSIMSIGGSLTGSTLLGVIFLKENITIKLLLAISATILSVIIPMLETKSSKQKQSFKTYFIYLYLFVFSMIASAVGTIYLVLPIDPIQYYTQSNIVLVVVCLLVLPLTIKRTELKTILNIFNKRQLGFIAGRSGLSFFGSLVTVKILTTVSVAINSIISTALSLIAATTVSAIIYKQRLNILQIISLLLVISATILCSF